jgi:threonine dehydrogenase-like Zn-dependent dehydrogenase
MSRMASTPTTRSFWIREPGHGQILCAELPPRQAGEVRVRALYSGISRGTEALVFKGQVPPSQRAAMRAPFQDGEFPGPLKYGYSSVGVVEEGSDRLRGRTVFCLYPHQDRYCVPAEAVHVVPAGVPAPRAVLAANMETAVNVVWDARPAPGDEIVVIGGGVVGLLAACLCRDLPGARVTVVDPNRSRAGVAADLGLAFVPEPPDTATADLVIHASGHPAGLRAALAVAGPEATIVEASWYGASEVPLPLGAAFHARRLTIRSSQVGQVPPGRAPRWSRGRRLELALSLLADPRLDALLTGESAFDDLPAVLAALAAEPGDTLCHRVRYPDRPVEAGAGA